MSSEKEDRVRKSIEDLDAKSNNNSSKVSRDGKHLVGKKFTYNDIGKPLDGR